MAALTQARNTMSIDGNHVEAPVASGVRIYAGAAVFILAGLAQPATATAGGYYIGEATKTVDARDAVDGDLTIRCHRHTMGLFPNDPAELANTSLGQTAYFVDDQTVTLNGTDTTHTVAGTVRHIENNQLYVEPV